MLEGDALQVVKVVNSKNRNLSSFGQIVDDTRIVLNLFSSCQIHYISRIANNAAHGLTKVVVKHIIDQV
jgi:hypothetical protein